MTLRCDALPLIFPRGPVDPARSLGRVPTCRRQVGVWRNGSASDSRSEGWEFESLCPHISKAAVAALSFGTVISNFRFLGSRCCGEACEDASDVQFCLCSRIVGNYASDEFRREKGEVHQRLSSAPRPRRCSLLQAGRRVLLVCVRSFCGRASHAGPRQRILR